MRIRWKLLFLLLAIALLPLLLISYLDNQAARQMGRHLAARTSQALIDGASRQLHQVVVDHADIFARDRQILELAVRVQAEAIERNLACRPGPSGDDVLSPHDFDAGRGLPQGLHLSFKHSRPLAGGRDTPLPVTYRYQVVKLLPGGEDGAARQEAGLLAGLSRIYQSLVRAHPDLIHWQYTYLISGVVSAYPGRAEMPPEIGKLAVDWLDLAADSRRARWTKPTIDPLTERPIFAVCRAVRWPDGRVAGVTVINVLMANVLKSTKLAAAWTSDLEALIITATPEENGTGGKVDVIAHQEYLRQQNHWRPIIVPKGLDSSDTAQFAEMVGDMLNQRTGIRRMPYHGRESLWAYGVTDQPNTYLVIIVPYDSLLAEGEAAEDEVWDLIFDQLGSTAIIFVVVVVSVIILSLAGSRSITRPIQELVAAARRVAAGDLKARADIDTGDELSELGRDFNRMIPQLQERFRMIEALNLAREVQQNLLPERPPEVPGFDIAGKSIYCDQTGGDYYDFLEFSGLEGDRFAVLVGDVSGHGIASALLMATARALLRSLVVRPDGLDEVMTAVNRRLSLDSTAGRFMTLFCLMFDLNSGVMSWTSAGHDPALLYDPVADSFIDLAGQDIPLGIDGRWVFAKPVRRDWRPGEVVVMGTDGVWEARDEAGRMFGKDILKELIRGNADRPAAEMVEAVIQALLTFVGDRTPSDDITLVIIKAGG